MSRLAPLARLLVGLLLVAPLVAGAHPAAAQERPTTSTTVSDARMTQAADIHRDDASPSSRRPAWTVFGVGIGQVQILFSGLLLATAVVGTYRVATRGSRYGR